MDEDPTQQASPEQTFVSSVRMETILASASTMTLPPAFSTMGNYTVHPLPTITVTTNTAPVPPGGIMSNSPAMDGTMVLHIAPDGTTISVQDMERRYAEQLEAQRQRTDAHIRALREAEERAQALLLSLLSPEQAAQYRDPQQCCFEVTGSAGGRYRLRLGAINNIDHLAKRTGRVYERWCVQFARTSAPAPDLLAAQLLMLVTDEPRLRAIARKTRVRRS